MLVDLTNLLATLARHRLDPEHRYLRDSISVLAQREKALDRLEAHTRDVAAWCQARVDDQAARLNAERKRIEDEREVVFAELRGIYETLSLDTPESPDAARSSWPLISDAVARAERDDRLLRDPALDADIATVGAVTPAPVNSTVEAGRRARQITFEVLPDLAAQLIGIDERVQATSVEEFDRWAAATEQDLAAHGWTSAPGDPRARPQLDPALIHELRSVGVDLWEGGDVRS